jgi:hypothetical protein
MSSYGGGGNSESGVAYGGGSVRENRISADQVRILDIPSLSYFFPNNFFSKLLFRYS